MKVGAMPYWKLSLSQNNQKQLLGKDIKVMLLHTVLKRSTIIANGVQKLQWIYLSWWCFRIIYKIYNILTGASIHFSDWGGGQKLEKCQNFRRALRTNLQYKILRALRAEKLRIVYV